MLEWISGHKALMAWLGAASALMFVGTLVAVPFVVAWLPKDYFRRRRRKELLQTSRHPAFRLAWWVVKNVLAVLLILLGIAMLVLPGQGVLTILLGLVLLDFPGKRRVELALVRRPRVLASLNWLRCKMGRPPLEV
ncbi:MAG TPA: hypothetical protein PLQ00_08580 [Thermoguttaceae bacterium]|nr:hypothetical protein [Thermoguttaceae bacterium]